jgi:uncharacterized membrane protein YgcG
MEWLLIVLAVGGAGIVGRRWQLRRALADVSRTELEGVRRLAEEDVTVLGEQLRRLDAELGARALDDAARVDYQTALDAYESAGRAVPRIKSADEISKVVDTLSTGRYALACVRARVDGLPIPERRIACFFNPQHGPSVTDVMWTPGRGRGTRQVPVCAQDAARVAAHEDPEVRTVTIRSRRVPYWEAGAAYLPYAEGYFASASLMTWAFATPVEGGSWSGPDSGGFGGGGFDGGFDGGGGGDSGS